MSCPQAPRYSTSEDALARSPSLSFSRITWDSYIDVRVRSEDHSVSRGVVRLDMPHSIMRMTIHANATTTYNTV
jgi:hypothetical protein